MDRQAPTSPSWLEGMSRRRQWMLAMGGTAILVLLLAAAYFVLRPGYQVLFRDLKPHDASAIVAELEKEKIPYRIDEANAAILVPDNDTRATRLKLMSGDLRLNGVVGLELFNNSDLGLTDFAQKVNYQRALQGELERTIMTLDEIDMARVHLTLPESSIFKHDKAQPKASVAIFLHEGSQLSPDTIMGIQRLVSASVPEMKASDVTVLDRRGNPAAGKDDAEVDDPQFALKRAIESYYQHKVLAQIDPLIGTRQVTVSVNADIDFDQTRITRESDSSHATENGKPRSPAVDLPGLAKEGTKTALPPLPGLDATTPATVPSPMQTNRTLEQIVSSPGSIRHLSVGVAFDKPLPDEYNVKLSALIAASIGLDTKRGDVLSIFTAPLVVDPAPAQRRPSDIVSHPSNVEPKVDVTPARPVSPGRAAGLSLPGIVGLVLLGLMALTLFAWLARSRSAPKRLTAIERQVLASRLQRLLMEQDRAHVDV